MERIDTYSFEGEAVLTAGDGVGTGKVFHYINGKFDFHQRVYKISNFDDRLDGYFFYLYFSSYFLARITSMTAKSSVDSVRRNMIAKMVIPLPEKNEQIAIAETIRDTSELIDTLGRLIEKKKNIRQGVIQELLTRRRRLPGFRGDWKLEKLGENSTLKARIGWQGLTTAEYLDRGDFYLVTGTDFVNGTVDWENSHYVYEHRYSQDPNIQLKPKDVLITKDGTIGKVAFVESLRKPGTLNSGVFVIRPKSKSYEPKFLYYILSSRYFKQFLNRLSAASTISHLYQKDFVHFEFPLPPTEEEQSAIAHVLTEMDAEIAELEKMKEKYIMIRNGITQQLLTGRIRIR